MRCPNCGGVMYRDQDRYGVWESCRSGCVATLIEEVDGEMFGVGGAPYDLLFAPHRSEQGALARDPFGRVRVKKGAA